MNKKLISFTFGLAFFLSIGSQAQVAIKSTLFGQNAWYIDVTNLTVSGTGGFSYAFDQRLTDIAASGVEYVRIGGIDPNFFPLYNFNPATFALIDAPRLIHLIDAIRTAGMKPIIEVGFNPLLNYYDGVTCSDVSTLNNVTQTNQATIAGNLVDYFNNASTGIYKLDPIVYWIIANEPDLAKNCLHRGLDLYAQTSATTIASYVKEFATKMKDKDPNIKIIGSELAQFGNDNGSSGGTYYNPSNKIMDDLVNNPVNASSIMGTVQTGNGTGKYYIDVISFHYYPNLSVRADVISNPTNLQNGFKGDITDDLINGNQWKSTVEMISDNSTGRTLTGSTAIGIACNEFNLENAETSFDESTGAGYSNMIKGVGNRSYLGGQWMSEILFESMNSPWMEFVNPWSAQEGDCTDGKGYISDCGSGPTYNYRPTYWHYKMIASNFKGDFLPNLLGNSGNYKTFAYMNTANEIGVIVMNQDIQSPRGTDITTKTVGISFNNNTPTETLKLKLNITSPVPTTTSYSCTITNETTMLLVFNRTTGALIRKEVYNLGDALRTIDTGSEVWGLGTGTPITTQAQFNSYYDAVYSDLTITPASPITEVSTDTKTLRYTNNAIVNGDFTVPSGATFTLLPTISCP